MKVKTRTFRRKKRRQPQSLKVFRIKLGQLTNNNQMSNAFIAYKLNIPYLEFDQIYRAKKIPSTRQVKAIKRLAKADRRLLLNEYRIYCTHYRSKRKRA